MEEKKQESPTATDCKTLTLVDVAPSQSASLVEKNQELGVDQEIIHEDNFSAAPAASNLENLNQPQNQAQPCLSSSLLVKKEELGDDAITLHEETFSAAPVNSENSHSAPSSQEPKPHSVRAASRREGVCGVAADSDPEKWSYEAVVERSRIRPWRMEKLKIAEQWRENPGDDFLMECWADDPALRIVIKKLVIKCPHWGLVAADGLLIEWNR